MFVVHPARIKCHIAQMMVTQDFPAQGPKFLTTTHAALLSESGGIINSMDGTSYQKDPARGDATGVGSHCSLKRGAKATRCQKKD